jgi:hypothetical protein
LPSQPPNCTATEPSSLFLAVERLGLRVAAPRGGRAYQVSHRIDLALLAERRARKTCTGFAATLGCLSLPFTFGTGGRAYRESIRDENGRRRGIKSSIIGKRWGCTRNISPRKAHFAAKARARAAPHATRMAAQCSTSRAIALSAAQKCKPSEALKPTALMPAARKRHAAV